MGTQIPANSGTVESWYLKPGRGLRPLSQCHANCHLPGTTILPQKTTEPLSTRVLLQGFLTLIMEANKIAQIWDKEQKLMRGKK